VWPYPHDPIEAYDLGRPMWIRERQGFGQEIKGHLFHWVERYVKDETAGAVRTACGYTIIHFPAWALHEIGGHNICQECRKASIAHLGEWNPVWAPEVKG
jgi:hypothetical protein